MSTIRYTAFGDYNANFSEEAIYDHTVFDSALSLYQVYSVGSLYFRVDSVDVFFPIYESDGTSLLLAGGVGLMYDFSDLSVSGYAVGGRYGDLIRTGSGNDTLLGGSGDDTLEGGLGDNTIDGGLGINTVSYEHLQGMPVYVDLASNLALSRFDQSLEDQLTNMQNIRGSAQNDDLRGDGNSNTIEGGGGGDQLWGRGGDDRLILKDWGQADGGDDYDILVLESAVGAYQFSLTDVRGVEQVNLRDGVIADFASVTAPPSIFMSMSRADGGVSLTTTGLADTVRTGLGTDTILAGGGNDRIIVGSDGGYVDAGAGDDILDLASSPTAYQFTGSTFIDFEQVNLRDGVQADFRAMTAPPSTFRSVSLVDGGVSLTTTDRADKILAGRGKDTISAGGGDDTVLLLDGGSATIEGGDGTDRLLVQSGSHAFTDATLNDMEFLVVRSGASLDLGAMTTSAGKITSTSVAGDGATIIGTAGAEWIRLGAGGDEATGGAGNDTLVGGAGEDTFRYEAGGFGRDQLFADLAMDHVDLAGVAASLDDLSFRISVDGNDVLVSIAGLPSTDLIVLNDVTLADVQAANGFFLF